MNANPKLPLPLALPNRILIQKDKVMRALLDYKAVL
jgi:hypothetical protein